MLPLERRPTMLAEFLEVDDSLELTSITGAGTDGSSKGAVKVPDEKSWRGGGGPEGGGMDGGALRVGGSAKVKRGIGGELPILSREFRVLFNCVALVSSDP